MRVLLEVLIPGMEDAEEADLSAEMLGIAGDLEQRLGAGAEQKAVDHLACSAGPAAPVHAADVKTTWT